MDPPPARQPGALILGGKYRLDAPHAVGGMSTIWLGTHVTLGRAVAVKFVDVRGTDRTKAAERFLREGRLAASIHHPNVIDVVDFGITDAGEPVMVMERLSGKTLGERMAMTPGLTTPQVVQIMVQVLGALDAVHRAGIVHCDLKPENVMLDAESERGDIFAWLIDFGIAHATDPSSELRRGRFGTDTHSVTGTPEYMAPEQAEGRSDLDVRVDVYAASVMLYELLSGVRPFTGDTPGRVIFNVVAGAHAPLHELRPDVPEIADVVWAGMSHDREHRPQTAGELRRLLEEALAKDLALAHRGATTGAVRAPTTPSAATLAEVAPADPSADAIEEPLPPLVGSARARAVVVAAIALALVLIVAVTLTLSGVPSATPGARGESLPPATAVLAPSDAVAARVQESEPRREPSSADAPTEAAGVGAAAEPSPSAAEPAQPASGARRRIRRTSAGRRVVNSWMIPGSEPLRALASAVGVVVALLAASHGVHAQDRSAASRDTAAARALFSEGVALAHAGDYAEAADRFRRADALHSAPTITFNLASALVHLGRLVEGLELIETVLRDPTTPPALAASARQQRDQTAPRVARLTLTTVGATAGIRVEVDALEVHVAAIGVAVPYDPGGHDVRALRGDELIAEEHVELAEGESRALALALPPDPSAPASGLAASMETTDASRSDDAGSIVLGVVLGVVAVAAITTTVVLVALPSEGGAVPGNTMPAVLTW